jgi:diguanylate cyclase (GGDEF)-like protein/PAS domain S-box-containing protein
LPYAQWEGRQRVVILILWCHAVGLTIFGVIRGKGLAHAAAEGAVVAVAAVLAGQKHLGRNRQSVIAALGLVAASGVFVHLSGGVIEVHFHFFIMVAILTLYEDWVPFLVAITFVVVQHGLMGVIDPHSVYNHTSAINGPWKWAGIHGLFVLGASVANIVAWRKNEDTRLDLQESMRSLTESEERFRSLVQNASDIAVLCDREGRMRYVSPSVTRVFGYEPEALVGASGWSFIHPDDLALVEAAWEAAVASTEPFAPIEYRARHANGTWRWVELMIGNLLDEPAVRGMTLNFRDITERRAAEEAMLHQAFHDTLTGLPNRALFLDRLSQALARRGRRGAVAVLFLDLDRFKWINDSLGHAAGDELLTLVANRLKDGVRPGDSVARFGGDEFVVLCDDLDGEREAVTIAERLTAELAANLSVEGRDIKVTASVGIATTASSGDPTAGTMLRDADAAMYRAKERGRNRIEVFHRGMRTRAVHRLEIETDLRRALDRGELEVHYQPIVRLATARMVAVEALVRWNHPERGLMAPMEFIPVAEETGLILPLGAFVLDESCRQVADWNRRYPDRPPMSVAVNLSARQMSAAHLSEMVAATLADSGLSPGLLSLEITESVLMEDVGASRTVLQSLKELGVRLGIDDFGTGYSSLLYLRRFPVDFLKVDRSFVSGLGSNSEDGAIVAGVVGLANALGVEAVAEGVEQAGHAEKLVAMGCEFAQGYLWSKPLPAPDLEADFERLWPPVSGAKARKRAVPVRVVLADDRAELRAVMRMALELSGNFEVVGEAGDGSDAIRVVREQQPDLVLLDVLMPEMSGLQALPHIASVAPNSKVVILTAVDTSTFGSQPSPEAVAMFDKAIGPARVAEQLAALFS